jgi:hypothetical protein
MVNGQCPLQSRGRFTFAGRNHHIQDENDWISESEKELLASLARICGSLLLLVFLSFTCLDCQYGMRIGSLQELRIARIWDIFLGLSVSLGAFLLVLGSRARLTIRRLAIVLASGVIFSGSLWLAQDCVMEIRWHVSKKTLAQSRVKQVYHALHDYAHDCGGFPPQEIGLAALHTNPDVKGWKGPYLDEKQLSDPWGNLIQYEVHGDRVDVWPNGPDGRSGTEDDIRWEDQTEQGRVKE